MKTVALLSQKGGAGKTTLALHLACAAKASGLASAIIDLDPQASAAAWHDSRADEEPVVVPLPYTRLAQGLDTARAGSFLSDFLRTDGESPIPKAKKGSRIATNARQTVH